MLYKFKSKATGDLIMLQPNGQHVLEIIGKHDTAAPGGKGILLLEDMPAALTALQHAIEAEEQARQAAIDAALAEHQTPPHFEAVGLRQRAVPFMEMIRHCQREEVPLTWGV
jgi:hypothetical protein